MKKLPDSNLAARLRERVTLQQFSLAPDGAGGYAKSWQDVATLWAEVTPLSGREQLRAMTLEASVNHRIILRYRAGVTAGMRILMNERIFNIRAVINMQERESALELLAEEGVAT